jgi:hypothetical protein
MTDNGDAIPKKWSSGPQAGPRLRALSGLFTYWDEWLYTLSGIMLSVLVHRERRWWRSEDLGVVAEH